MIYGERMNLGREIDDKMNTFIMSWEHLFGLSMML